jgi:glycosyltransferase involved in cell wall biosynthesis
LGTIYHGLPKASLNPSYSPGSYLAFLGRLTAEKGPERAIRIANAVNMPLHIAAKIPRGERGYFKEKLEPLIDGERIRLKGEVDNRGKQPFLANGCRGDRTAWRSRPPSCSRPLRGAVHLSTHGGRIRQALHGIDLDLAVAS